MQWDFKKSEKLKRTIAKNEDLMRALSKAVEEIFTKHGIKLKNNSYVFEPRVFHGDPAPWEPFPGLKPVPLPGPLDPDTLRKLDKLRIFRGAEKRFEDLIPMNSESLIMRIVGDTELLGDLSKSIFGVLQKHGITFEENEGCVFTPVVFETPIHARKVPITYESQQFNGYEPKIYASSESQLSFIRIRPFPGVIEPPELPPIPGIIWRWRWWIGIPAPEMLRALDILREERRI